MERAIRLVGVLLLAELRRLLTPSVRLLASALFLIFHVHLTRGEYLHA